MTVVAYHRRSPTVELAEACLLRRELLDVSDPILAEAFSEAPGTVRSVMRFKV